MPISPRRPRKPWQRPWKARSVEWFDGNSSGSPSEPDQCSFVRQHYTCGAHAFELTGQTDTEHLDRQENTILRVVGQIQTNIGFVSLGQYGADPIRYGLLVVGDNEDLSTWTIPRLIDADDIEKYEWMWLHQAAVRWQQVVQPGGAEATTMAWTNVEFDVKVKRKLGKNDKLVMVRFFPDLPTSPGGLVYHEARLLRVLVKTG